MLRKVFDPNKKEMTEDRIKLLNRDLRDCNS